MDCLKEYMKEPIPNKINTGIIIEAYVFWVSFEVRKKNIIKNMTYMMTYKTLEIWYRPSNNSWNSDMLNKNQHMQLNTITNVMIENTIAVFVWFSWAENSPGIGVVGKRPLFNNNINVQIDIKIIKSVKSM